MELITSVKKEVKLLDLSRLRFGAHDLAAFVLVAFALGLYLWRFESFQVGAYIDDARYITLAQSIVQGEGYGIVDSSRGLIQATYPVGFPLVLAPVYALFGSNFVVLKTVSLLFTLASILLIIKAWKPLGLPNATMALAIAALVALAPVFVKHAGMVMSEAAFGFFVLLGLVLTVRSEGTRSANWRYFALGIVWMLAGSVRTIGITLIGASALYLVLRRRWRNLALAIAGFVFALTLVLVLTDIEMQDLNSVGEYVRQAQNVASLSRRAITISPYWWIGRGITDYLFIHFRDAMVPLIGGPTTGNLLSRIGLGFIPEFISILVLISLAAGYVLNIRKNGWLPVHFYIPMSMGILVLWFGRGERFLYGLMPFLFAFLLIGGHWLIRMVAAGVRKFPRVAKFADARFVMVAQVGVLGLLLIMQFVGSIRIADSVDHVPDFRIGNAWIKEHTSSDAIVFAEDPEIVYLYSQRTARKLPTDAKNLNAQGDSVYVLIAPALYWYPDKDSFQYSRETLRVLDQLQTNVMPYELVFEDQSAKIKVYRVLREPNAVSSK